MWYRLLVEALLSYSKASGEYAYAINVVHDVPTQIRLA
jgi:hypothetical protein